MMWSNKWVGTPYEALGRTEDGVDCWGLVQIVYREELNITLPAYLGYASVEEHGEIANLIGAAKASQVWVPNTGQAYAFDVAVFRRGYLDTHVGIVVERGLMLHMDGDDCAKHTSYTSGQWCNRLTGIYRHVDVISQAAS
ncbi:NlpC/P60 family protein [uncultured Tateyamaria sp.]|uniref:NlpC/P60 family protein n=1 Tax=uncultured Tateyamaria sp. TaxID=455651 RepID=UPI00261590E0|nr:NlpC/P60 family protein [uncultured Tateyamaria sp.]